MSSADRKILEKELARFFGFDNADDAADILDSILSIESNEDLLEYLSSLLGPSYSATDDISRQTFAINLQKWKNGETIDLTSQTASSSTADEKEESVEQKYNVTKKENKNTKPMQNRNNKNKKAHAKEMRRKKAMKQNRNTNTSDVSVTTSNNTQKQEAPKKPHVTTNITKSQKPVQKPQVIATTILDYSLKISNLPKGESKILCGCFGTFHKPLTNCLYCGRIVCTREEECTFCPSCNRALIYPSSLHTIFGTTNAELENAIQHKDKLLRYENEQSKKRTEVYDDEKDYYSNKTSMWLTKEERLDSEQREELRRKELHQRKKALLKDFF